MRNWECEISQLGNTNIYEVFLLKIYENYIYIYIWSIVKEEDA